MKTAMCVTMCFSIFLSGCASVMCGSEKTVNIKSRPSGAAFTIMDAKGNTVVENVTPTNVTLKRGRGWFQAADYKVIFRKEGCKQMTVPIQQGLEAGWYVGGNILIGGLIGWIIVDPLTGAMWNIEDVNVSLRCD
ncbi:MAG TPA: hypothetical protein VMW72_25715 [Sedimentisphaerales bacterium]|nr:hypothetical protein [Sedimentisphaerales bacterium]